MALMDGPFDGRGGRIDVFVELSQAEIARRCAAFDPMLRILKAAADQFAFYAASHRAKSTPDGDEKAATNDRMEAACRAAIAQAEGR